MNKADRSDLPPATDRPQVKPVAPESAAPYLGRERRKHTNAYPMQVCSKCNAVRLERCKRTGLWQLLLSAFSLFPYKCRICFRRQYCFVPSVRLVYSCGVGLLLLWTSVLLVISLRSLGTPLAVGTATLADRVGALRRDGRGATPPAGKLQTQNGPLVRNDDIIQLVNSGVSIALMKTMIQSSDSAAFDLSPGGIMRMKASGVDNVIISSMFDRSTEIALGAAR